MFNKLMGGKKSKGGFYLEINEDEKAPAIEEQQATTVSETAVEAAPAVEAVEAVEAAPEVERTPAKANKKAKAKGKVEKVATTTKKETPAANKPKAPAPQSDVPFWVPLLYTSEKAKAEAEANSGFATKYLVPTTSAPRRRPGGSLNSFLDMARQMNNK
jgi:hypothetical protein